jgi:hypothetical protein
MLNPHRHLVTVGLRNEPLPGSNAMSLLDHGAFFGGLHSANKEECLQIHQLVVNKSVKPQITLLPMSDAQEVVEAVKRYELKCKYGYALTQDLEAADKCVKDDYKSIHICFDIRACTMKELRPCTLFDVKDVSVLATDAYPHVLTSNLNLDPMLANTVSILPSINHLIISTISRRTHSYRYLFTPSTRRSPLHRGLKVAPHRKSQG